MEDFSSEILSVDLSCFTAQKSNLNPLEVDKKFSINEITDYLESIVLDTNATLLQILYLPSLEALANYFNCSYLDVHDAFRLLRERGFDYEIKRTSEAMKVWKRINIIANLKENES